MTLDVHPTPLTTWARTHPRAVIFLAMLAALATALAVTTLARTATPTMAVYTQDWQGDHYEGKYVAHVSGLGVQVDGLANMANSTCKQRPDGPNGEPFIRCAPNHFVGPSYPNSQPFEEAK